MKIVKSNNISADKKNEYLELLKLADAAQKNSYSPYSEFKVGAALLTKGSTIFCGSNIENASYGLTICAERVAIFSAISQGASSKDIEAIAISANGDLFSPCGACRQVISEFGADIFVIFRFEGEIIMEAICNLLPYSFSVKI